MFTVDPLPRTLDAACRDVRHRKESVRRSALRDLARHAESGHAEAVAALAEAVTEDAAPAVRGEACVALADAGAPSAVRALLAAADDAHERVRQMAIVALGELGSQAEPDLGPRIREHLQAALDADAPAIRYQALIGWSRVAGDEAVAAIDNALLDSDAEVRHVALRLAEERWFADGTPSPAALAAAERAAADESPKVRAAAAVVLGRARAAAAPEALTRAIATDDGADAEDLQMAIELAGELGVDRAASALARRAYGVPLLSDPLAWHARIALARLGDERARRTILRGLDAWSRDARSLAVVAVGRARLAEALPLLRAMLGDARRAEPTAVAEALTLLEGEPVVTPR